MTSAELLDWDRQDSVCFGCGGPAKPGMLMCWNDWKRVPRVIQRAVWSSPGIGPEAQRPRFAARIAVAVKEGLPVDDQAVQLLASYGIAADGYPEGGRR